MVCLLYRSRPCRNHKCDPVCGGKRITVEGILEEGKTVDSHCDWLLTIYTQAASVFFPFDLYCPHLLQSEDDCAGHETTIYTFLFGDQSINMTADMLGLRSFSKRGDVADVTLTVPADMTNSSVFNLSVMLSNTVEFMEIITSSTGGVRSALRSNTWTTTSDSYYCRCKLAPYGVVCCVVKPDDTMKCFECAYVADYCAYILPSYLVICLHHVHTAQPTTAVYDV